VKAGEIAALLPGEWAVLGVLTRAEGHGFAVARTLAPDGWLGRVWTMSRPRVYRAINDLAGRALIAPVGRAQSDRGPTRTLYAASPEGRSLLEGWLAEPVAHVRDIRSELLLKLALLLERGTDPTPLLEAQHEILAAALTGLESAQPGTPFDAILFRYRVETTRAALRFVEEILATHCA
jgi:DNA-binding PadR family transcriptional regulator